MNEIEELTNQQRIVDEFIRTMITHSDFPDVIIDLFRNGYCWHFAKMLQAVFERGTVCWAAPFGHMVWVDNDNTPYDSEGIYDGEALYFIPENYLGELVDDFKHTKEAIGVTKNDLKGIILQYCLDNKVQYYEDDINYFLK